MSGSLAELLPLVHRLTGADLVVYGGVLVVGIMLIVFWFVVREWL